MHDEEGKRTNQGGVFFWLCYKLVHSLPCYLLFLCFSLFSPLLALSGCNRKVGHKHTHTHLPLIVCEYISWRVP